MDTLKRYSHNVIFFYAPFLLLALCIGLVLANAAFALPVQISWDAADWEWYDRDFNGGPSGYDIQGSVLLINASGADVWTSYDRRDVYYRDDVEGNWIVTVKILSQENSNGWAKAGISVKNNLGISAEDDPGPQGYCMVAITPRNGYTFQWDGDGDGFLDSHTTIRESPSSTYPSWLKLKKEGQTFTAYYSTDGVAYNQIGSPQSLTSADNTQDVGVFVTSHNQHHYSEVEFENFTYDDMVTTTYTITASAGSNGSIDPTGGVLVAHGTEKTFTISPDIGYEIDEVQIDGSPVTLSGNTYTFTDVTADHSISASFVITTNIITATAGAHGTINPSGDVPVNYGSDQLFTVTTEGGYEVDTVLVNGVSATLTGNEYTFPNVTTGHTISVTFSPIVHTITATAGSNGSISPGTISVNEGDDMTFQVTIDSGYLVEYFRVDGSDAALDSNNEYTFVNVTSDHTVEVAFTDTPTITTEIPGCNVSTSSDYSGGFDAADFHLENVNVENGKLVLQTGAQAINPNSIIVPFKQEVAVTFIYEGAGYVSDFGYVLYEDAVDANGDFKGWNNIPNDLRHPVFHNIRDDSEPDDGGCCGGGDGVLDTDYGNGSFPTSDEAALAAYDDGTGLNFSVDGDGQVTAKDMRKVLGTFEAGTELVFFLTANKDWNTSDTAGVFFTKKDWNPDTYGACTPPGGDAHWVDEPAGIFDKTYYLDQATTESCGMDKGWLAQPAITRMNDIFGIALSGQYDLRVTDGEKYAHVIVGAPADDPNQWILGWEDLTGGGDADHNDMVFRIERNTGGTAQLQSSEAIAPSAVDAYYSAVTFEVYDSMPCSGDTNIIYYLSVDDGANWVEITDWDTIKESDAAKHIYGDVTNWTPGNPQYTLRTVRIDFAALGFSGRELIWKAELESQNEACSPGVTGAVLKGSVATHGSFARSSPVVQTNVIYSGSYETPAISWTDKVLRGHLKATRLYDPGDPSQTDALEIWDAGAVLNSKEPSARTIYFPAVTVSQVIDEVLATGDGSTTAFSGTLAHYPVSATTLIITDQTETFEDKHTEDLEGSLGGTGTINRFTGAFTITFNNAPGSGVPIKASYSYYAASGTLMEFNTTNVTSDMLGLDATYISPDGFTYDLNNDGKFNNVDSSGDGTPDDSDGDWLVQWVRGYKDGSGTKKEWLLGAIDHSVPAVATPPGLPKWYFGTDITFTERQSYNTFREAWAQRPTVIYVGARDGMIHAFYAGKFRWGNNPETTTITENRGYFLWETSGDSSSANYGTGEELWAFIPANLMPRLKNNLLQADDQSYVDASPTLENVYTHDAWRTVLLSAEGNGGDSVFCLDVTDPNNPSFLWEFADPDLFRSRSSPAVGRIGRIVVEGSTKWAAFFVSGKTYDSSLYPSVYMIDIADGSVLQRIYLDADSNGIGGVPSGQPAIVDSDGNGFIDRIYIGTDKGFMYKVNIPDDPDTLDYFITNCVINRDFTDENNNIVLQEQQYHPIYASPAIVIENGLTETGDISYNIKIFFGTGDNPFFDEDINMAETRYHFFAYSDQEGKGVCDASSVLLDWFIELPEGHRIFASAFAAAGNIYFGTSTAETEDPCEAAEAGFTMGRFYAVTTSGIQKASFDVSNITSAPVVEDQHLYFRTTDGLSSIGSGQYNTAVRLGGTAVSTIGSWKEID